MFCPPKCLAPVALSNLYVLLRDCSHGESFVEIRDKPSVTVHLDSQGHRESISEFTISIQGRPLWLTPICSLAACCG